MAAATILYVGDDYCHRIPVMERSGLFVVRSGCSATQIQSSLAKIDPSAVAFHNDRSSPPESVMAVARERCRAPLILFRNPSLHCNERLFDLVIPELTSPEVWSKTLSDVIRESKHILANSRQLRADCAVARDVSRDLREASARNRVAFVEPDGLFWGEIDGTEDE